MGGEEFCLSWGEEFRFIDIKTNKRNGQQLLTLNNKNFSRLSVSNFYENQLIDNSEQLIALNDYLADIKVLAPPFA